MPALDRKRAVESCYLIPGWCFPTELGAIYDLVAGSCFHVELGTFCGRSLFVAVASLAEGAKAVAVEPFIFDCFDPVFQLPSRRWPMAVWGATHAAMREVRPDITVEHWPKPSLDAARICSSKVDSLYIDANHHYAEVLGDLEAWFPKVKSGGLLIGHDYWAAQPGVIEAVEEFFGTRSLTYEIIPQTRLWFHRKR
jgi:hypothetical protein